MAFHLSIDGRVAVLRVLASDQKRTVVAAQDRIRSLRVIALHLRVPGRCAGHDLNAGSLPDVGEHIVGDKRAGVLDHDAL